VEEGEKNGENVGNLLTWYWTLPLLAFFFVDVGTGPKILPLLEFFLTLALVGFFWVFDSQFKRSTNHGVTHASTAAARDGLGGVQQAPRRTYCCPSR
jgi:hypothetical protein